MVKSIKVIKRDGRVKDFNKHRIVNAIDKAYDEVYKNRKIQRESKVIANNIENIVKENVSNINIEDIQDFVVEELKRIDNDVAIAYSQYRRKREKQRIISHYQRLQDEILNYVSTLNDNANVDENSFSGREQRLLQHITKELALQKLPKEIAQLHRDVILYQHDLDKFVIGMHNCLFPRMKKLLEEGFNTRQADVKPPKHFYSVSQVIPVILQLQSQY